MNATSEKSPILVLGANGKTGRRIVPKLTEMGYPVRKGSRQAEVPFDWADPSGWDAVLEGVGTAYISYYPDLAIPGAADAIQALVDRAVEYGVERLVLLSGRGEEEAQKCEAMVQRPEVEWTVVRCGWFNQNFSEGAFLPMVQAGEIVLPAGNTQEPFVDVDDIADVATAALTEDGHAGHVYELTGPRLLTFSEAAAEISAATQRTIRFLQVPHQAFLAGLASEGVPGTVAWLLDYLFTTVLDGRNAYLTDGVQRALGREPRDFSDYCRATAASGVWHAAVSVR